MTILNVRGSGVVQGVFLRSETGPFLKRLRPILSSMEHGSDEHLVASNYVGSNVGCSRNDQFACFRNSSRSARQREVAEAIDCFLDSLGYFTRSHGTVNGYVRGLIPGRRLLW